MAFEYELPDLYFDLGRTKKQCSRPWASNSLERLKMAMEFGCEPVGQNSDSFLGTRPQFRGLLDIKAALEAGGCSAELRSNDRIAFRDICGSILRNPTVLFTF